MISYTIGYHVIRLINNVLVLNDTKFFNLCYIVDFCALFLKWDA